MAHAAGQRPPLTSRMPQDQGQDPGRPVARWRCPWPGPALLAWLLAWAAWWTADRAGAPAAAAWVAGCATGGGLGLVWPGLARWRRVWLAAGFPASALGLGLAQGLPAWAWLLPLALLMLAYPLRAWRDAPLFPTPPDALHGLAQLVSLRPGAAVLDAGCGLGQGLAALRAEFPAVQLHGTEWSPLLALLARARCRYAEVQRGDLWAEDWSRFELVYLFQRPESMDRAWQKACAEMVGGGWLVSLDFAVPGVEPTHSIEGPGVPSVWIYSIGHRSTPGGPRRYPTQTTGGLPARAGAPLAPIS